MAIPRVGDLVLFPDKSIGYVYKSLSKKRGNINHIDFEMKLIPDTEYLKKTWLRFYMPPPRATYGDFRNNFVAEDLNFRIQKFGNKIIISATHRKWKECCRLAGWDILARKTHQNSLSSDEMKS